MQCVECKLHTLVLYIRSIVDEVLEEWEIHPSKVIASMTDNGSNMVSAFRVQIQEEGDDDDEDVDLEEDTEEQQDDFDH